MEPAVAVEPRQVHQDQPARAVVPAPREPPPKQVERRAGRQASALVQAAAAVERQGCRTRALERAALVLATSEPIARRVDRVRAAEVGKAKDAMKGSELAIVKDLRARRRLGPRIHRSRPVSSAINLRPPATAPRGSRSRTPARRPTHRARGLPRMGRPPRLDLKVATKVKGSASQIRHRKRPRRLPGPPRPHKPKRLLPRLEAHLGTALRTMRSARRRKLMLGASSDRTRLNCRSSTCTRSKRTSAHSSVRVTLRRSPVIPSLVCGSRSMDLRAQTSVPVAMSDRY